MQKIPIVGMRTEALRAWVVESLNEPAYRGNQIADWVYRKAVDSFEAMTNLPARMRAALAETAVVTPNRIDQIQRSSDGVVKCLLKLADENEVECVLLPYEDRVSVCLSTQVGCAMGCRFCATAQGGYTRNLTAGEIVDQLLHLQRLSSERITHVVLMGMGEPLLNLEAVVEAIHLIHDEVGISMRRITLSTVGIVPKIYALAEHRLPITLAISLHAPDDETRSRIMPVNRKWGVDALIQAARDYFETTGRRITFEYLLLEGVNDTPAHAHQLAAKLKGIPCLVNLIPFNYVPTPENFRRPSAERVRAFREILERSGIEVTQRKERGHDIDAACGQLRGKHRGKPIPLRLASPATHRLTG
ncbi:MAG: 23S rRNA (adenine(2503)-C(2))-methyltransferase RlmN [Armatimonadetes bacterium]|nr:23S rRNA (adenine(2503)-C(2))-methyltransferase RlmN [Armatimonadota bacterium]CUU34805.1 23S rRNA m(2)A-2503 methyltransferase [Armatimonadetes bacterium DC]